MRSAPVIPFIKDDGKPFDNSDLQHRAAELGAMNPDERVEARNQNAAEIARHDAARMLAVSGPGTGKSTLFKARLQHWLDRHPDHRLVVATFVRKLVRDLKDDIANDETIGDEQKARVSVLTLHSLARSVVERNQGTHALQFERHCLVITPFWQEVVWEDVVCLGGETSANFPWRTLEEHLFDGEPPNEAGWTELRELHLQLQQFYNALTFTDLILMGTQAVSENAELSEQTLFIVDEFQDFNLAEKTFIERLTADSAGVFLAGDDDQVLYDALRRGHPSIIRSYYHDTVWVNAMLPFCGRCDFHICRAAEAFLEAGKPTDWIEKVFLPLGTADGAAKVRVVASTNPSSGVEYIERFIQEHQAEIGQRQEELAARSEKDSYLLILTPARLMNFLTSGGARDTLRAAVRPYLSADEQLTEEYWRLVDYYQAGVEPSQNLAVRRVLFYERVPQDTVAALLLQALESKTRLCDLGDEIIDACLAKCAQVKGVLQSELAVDEKAEKLEAIGGLGAAEALGRDLGIRPVGSFLDFEAESAAPEQAKSVGAVEITTIVGAKGLSADHVIVLGCDEVNLAPISRSAFFVALTRARKSLTLMACMAGGGATQLHEFVCSLPDEHVEALQARAGGGLSEFATIGELQTHLGKIAYAKQMSAKRRARGR